ncbi:MAG: hypothetical protein LC789_13375 [Actinobacteria bacterium]|nr:hypothetical protein [Actinomycetota bacterium]MCA1721158.1 hypothetical protein [Actinomycetota bacterium]
MTYFLAHGELLVVETDDGKTFAGAVMVDGGRLVVRSGFAGRPAVLPVETVVRITPAAEHDGPDAP